MNERLEGKKTARLRSLRKSKVTVAKAHAGIQSQSICLSVCLSVYPSVHPSIHPSIYTHTRTHTHKHTTSKQFYQERPE